jgi:hypothetical protein
VLERIMTVTISSYGMKLINCDVLFTLCLLKSRG